MPDLQTSQGFDAFYRSKVRTVLRWVIRLGGPLLQPEEVTQDVFTVAFNQLGIPAREIAERVRPLLRRSSSRRSGER